jgi:hypothetical protein
MKEILKRLLKENHEMIMESNEIGNDTSYQSRICPGITEYEIIN